MGNSIRPRLTDFVARYIDLIRTQVYRPAREDLAALEQQAFENFLESAKAGDLEGAAMTFRADIAALNSVKRGLENQRDRVTKGLGRRGLT